MLSYSRITCVPEWIDIISIGKVLGIIGWRIMRISIRSGTSRHRRSINLKPGIIVKAKNSIDDIAYRAIHDWRTRRSIEGDRLSVELHAIVVDCHMKDLFDLRKGAGDIHE